MKTFKYNIVISCFFLSACVPLGKNKHKNMASSVELKFEEVYLCSPNFYPILDTAMFYSKEFNCYNKENSYFVIKFFNNDESVSLKICEQHYSEIDYMMYKLFEKKTSKLGFYYRNKFFWINHGAEIGYEYDLIKGNNKEFILTYSYKTPKKRESKIRSYELWLEYLYIDKEFILNKIMECSIYKL